MTSRNDYPAGQSATRLATDILLLAGFCGFLFFFGLSYFGLIGADEPRYAQVAREMFFRDDWVTPTLGGQPWLEKPVLYYWQAIVAYRIFGVSDWVARLPSAADATLMVVAVYFCMRRLRPPFHLDAALITASSAAVIGFARAASTDMPLAATFTIAMLAWYAWYESRNRFYLSTSFGFLGLAVLAKGPIAILLALLILILFACITRDLRLLRQTLWTPRLAIFLAVALPWYAAVQFRNPQFFRVFILEHNFARFGTNLYHHPEPFWYFIPVALIALLPWTTFAVISIYENLRSHGTPKTTTQSIRGRELSREAAQERSPGRKPWAQINRSAIPEGAKDDLSHASQQSFGLFLTLWLIVPIAFFSISRSKLPGYILPAIPAGSLLVAEYVRRHAKEIPLLPRNIVHAIVAASVLIPALMIQYILLESPLPWSKATIPITLAVICAVAIFWTLKFRGLPLLRFVTLIPLVLSVGVILRAGSPSLDAKFSARSLADEIRRIEPKLAGPSDPIRIAVFEAPRETEYGLSFYLNRPIARYENHQIPPGEHLVISPAGSQTVVASAVPGRRVSYLGTFAPQSLDYFWVEAEK